MKCPSLSELPPPPIGKTGWPWTEESDPISSEEFSSREWPTISIITPSYNQGQFIEETIRSILLQGYPKLEYIIMDGGSTDNTIEVIKKYEPWITSWVSEGDRGQSHAINKGFRQATGEWIGWQNSDDFYGKNCFLNIPKTAQQHPQVSIFYGKIYGLSEESGAIWNGPVQPYSQDALFPKPAFANQSMFFHYQLFQEGFFLDETLQICMDHEFYWRLASKQKNFYYIQTLTGYYRVHHQAKTTDSKNSRNKHDEYAQCYERVYGWFSDIQTRLKIAQGYQMVCNAAFKMGHYKEFQQLVNRLVKLHGIKAITLKMMVKYLASYPLSLGKA